MIFKFPYIIRLIDFNDYLINYIGEFIVFPKFPFMEYSIILKN